MSLTLILTLIFRADCSDKSEWYCWTIHCFRKIWSSKRTHPNEHWNGHQLYKRALGSDQSSVRSWPCAAAGRCAGRGCALNKQLANCCCSTLTVSVDVQGLRRSPSDAADASFRELTLHDAQTSLHNELERLINTARQESRTVSLGLFLSCYSSHCVGTHTTGYEVQSQGCGYHLMVWGNVICILSFIYL